MNRRSKVNVSWGISKAPAPLFLNPGDIQCT